MSNFRQIAQIIRPERATARGESLYERFRSEPDTLVVPILDEDDRPLGLIERNAFFLRMAAEYGRALYALRPVNQHIEPALVVEADEPVHSATSRALTDRPSDLLRGFVVVDHGRYVGVVTALELLKVAHDVGARRLDDLTASAREVEKAQLEAEEARRFLTTVVENIPAMVFVKSAVDHRYVLLNKAGEEIFGYERNQILGKTSRDLFKPDHAQVYDLEDSQVMQSGEVRVSEDDRIQRRDGGQVLLRTKKLAINGSDGRPQYLLGISEDITEARRAEARIAHMAHYDALTDLPNRVLFKTSLQAALARSRRDGEGVAVLCIDLDHFKTVNDTLGHPVGDGLLKAVGARLRDCVREGDSVARLGGDEFAIVQQGSDVSAVGALAARVVEVLARPFQVMDHQVVIGASVGIAVSPMDAMDGDELLKKADMALYRVKAEARSGFHFFEKAMDDQLQARRVLELDLRRAVQAGEFELHFQPLLNLESGQVAACEALIRWRHPDKGLIAPGMFIPLAEEIGLIVPMGEWVLREACAAAALWPDNICVAVNVSPVQFRSPHLIGAVMSSLASSGLEPHRLEIEITESVLLQDNAANLDVLHKLRALGVRISMDDFGTGYSSLSYLRSFPFDKIKIDQSFVRDLPHDADALAIIKAVTSLGASLGITTTAEGVETQGQMDQLRQNGCSEIQGFLISRPCPAAEIGALFGWPALATQPEPAQSKPRKRRRAA